MIFIIPILIFSLYLFIYNPGILTYESFAQVHQIASGKFTNSFPFFHTFIEMIFLNLFGTPLSIAVLQMLVFSTIWTIICKYHRGDEVEINNFILQFILTLVICLIPINAVYSITLWKEILFSYSLLFLTFLIKVLVDRSGEMDLKFTIILALTIAITSQLSVIGIYIGIITLIAVLAYLFLKNKNNDKTFMILPVLAIIFILLIGSLSFAFNVEDVQTNNSGGAPIVWSVLRGDDWNGQVYYITKDGALLKETQDKYYAANNITPTASYEKLTSPHQGEDRYNQINSIVVYFKDHTLTDTLFYSPALYMYMAIILLILMQVVIKSKEMYLIYVPNLINIIGVFLTCSLNENRFLYPNLLIFYLLVIIFISIYFKVNLKTLSLSANTQKSEKTTFKSEPAQDVYKPNVNQHYFENTGSENDGSIQEVSYDDIDINSILEDAPVYEEIEQIDENTPEDIDIDSDLIDEILKEIEMEKKKNN